MSALTGFLSVGLFVGVCHEFEEVWGETTKVWKIQNSFWSHKRVPMALAKPFGYSSRLTVLQISCFWCWISRTVALHVGKWWSSKKIIEGPELAEKELAEAKGNKNGGSNKFESSSGSDDVEKEDNFNSEA